MLDILVICSPPMKREDFADMQRTQLLLQYEVSDMKTLKYKLLVAYYLFKYIKFKFLIDLVIMLRDIFCFKALNVFKRNL